MLNSTFNAKMRMHEFDVTLDRFKIHKIISEKSNTKVLKFLENKFLSIIILKYYIGS